MNNLKIKIDMFHITNTIIQNISINYKNILITKDYLDYLLH